MAVLHTRSGMKSGNFQEMLTVAKRIHPDDAVCLTFGGGSKRFHGAAKRLGRSVVRQSIAKACIALDEFDLSVLPSTTDADMRFIKEGRNRGYGYWLWKPLLLQSALRLSVDGDRFLYLDAGFEVNGGAREACSRLFEYWDLALRQGVAAFDSGHQASSYTKDSVRSRLGGDFVDGQLQIATGAIFLVSGTETTHFIDEWLGWCRYEDYKLLSDSSSDDPEPCGFVQSRWEQALFSCEYWRHKFKPLPQEAHFGHSYWRWRQTGRAFPLWASRNTRTIPLYAWPPIVSPLGWLRLTCEQRWHHLKKIYSRM